MKRSNEEIDNELPGSFEASSSFNLPQYLKNKYKSLRYTDKEPAPKSIVRKPSFVLPVRRPGPTDAEIQVKRLDALKGMTLPSLSEPEKTLTKQNAFQHRVTVKKVGLQEKAEVVSGDGSVSLESANYGPKNKLKKLEKSSSGLPPIH